MNVPADFEQYIPVDKVVNRRTLDILKKLWTAETLQRLKLLITPSMGSKSCLGLYKCHSIDKSGKGSEDECKGTVEFRCLEGTLDPELILRWSQLMVSLFQFADLASPQAWQNFVPAVLQCLAFGKGGPVDNNEILPPLDEEYIDALREELCTREMRLPCMIQKAATLNESEASTNPGDLARLVSEKANFFNAQFGDALEITSGQKFGQTEEQDWDWSYTRRGDKKELQRYDQD
ncbi:hypothetical protein FCOIX_11313 [Fusarium coicis]|nr:hypothetical protein FCOIX_11313 [Fusarium coicis]